MSIQLCRGFTDEQWRGLKVNLIHNDDVQSDAAAWDCAITVFERRITERFFSCIEALEIADTKGDLDPPTPAPPDCSTLPAGGSNVVVPGFAIVGLCCLLIETLASFGETEKVPIPPPKRIVKYLQRNSFGGAFSGETAGSFVEGVRNGIFHDGETRKWVIWREEPSHTIVGMEGGQYFLNRTALSKALRAEFERYLADLRDPTRIELRKRFIEKMDDIVRKV